MLIGSENLVPKSIKPTSRMSSASSRYYSIRKEERMAEDKQGNQINFNLDYNKPLLKQYGQNQTPGPNNYCPNYGATKNVLGQKCIFARQKRLQSESEIYAPSSQSYQNNFGRIKYDEKKAISFPKSLRYNQAGETRNSIPGVGSYVTNKQYDLTKGKGVSIPVSGQNNGNSQRASTPGVGSYRIRRNVPNHSSYHFGKENRFQNNSSFVNSKSNFPGVGNYNVEKAIYKTSTYGTASSACGGVIGHSSRFIKRVQDISNAPGPLDYNIQGYFDKLSRNKIKNDLVHRRKNHGRSLVNIVV